ncbi:MAG: hypothetical protein DMF99_08025 [Acidobacteria bacterium]|nr:MAG: hypothetical protein DMF99_08025 [Acidobacteriota bacterium]
MVSSRRQDALVLCLVGVLLASRDARAQSAADSTSGRGGNADQHEQMQMNMNNGWQLMQDGIVFAEFNHQGGPRGGNEFVVPNWWMGMASREMPRGRLTLTSMLSLDPATVGKDGYREILQAGEAIDGHPLIDRQHPHDLFMQLAAVWRMPLTQSTGFTLAGGPVGEPALGPVAFMHRASAADNPTAPLGHHTFDSTHIAFGVVTAAVDHGPFVVEGSVFNGREPDENRWDFDFGRFDSVSGRVWYRPSDEWEFQASSGRLKTPEELEPGDIVRSTLSASWTQKNGAAISSVTAAYGRNNTDVVNGPAADVKDPAIAFTVGGVRDFLSVRGFEGGIGADVTFYGVPDTLQPIYTSHPVSFHVFVRLRPPAASMGRMWNMRMSQPMVGHQMP